MGWTDGRRLALLVVHSLGGSQAMLLLGFMLATAFLSMWISNTATAMMMMPIATPPNAIVYGTDQLALADMIRVGFWLNLAGAGIVTAAIFTWGGVLM